MGKWVTLFLLTVIGSVLLWIAIANALNESGDGLLSAAAVIAIQNGLIIVLLAAVLERLLKK
ncbi:hypothetical protein GS3922_01215 [Geobacillus subterraneus]|uniref:Uncharacterized protein n=2 Tax=Geobacillus TaxID=129337 RepID=A0ABN4NHK0_9BACL|nr:MULTISPECIES: hypothetical protein [Geobacillus]AMX82415.1 hypothetical protein GS3922_01215 [Geobacillus subterraneus]KZS26630.1 hypothetical protein A5418_05985 [Geobacillus subterraneus]OXB91448.1 hypothetical protein B9L21_01005 [Geobacillus uzenensis]QIZ68855.1 hypothetical protein HF500_17590 [Geobacillus subterraneus]WPZ17964.1 hypothetical protein UM396_15545 [Geobacillus subterraneus]